MRGAVPIILATYPFAEHIPQASAIFNLVFFVTFISVLLQGASIPFVAKRLGVDVLFKEKYRFPIEFNPTQNLRNKLIEVTVPRSSQALGKSLLELKLPNDVLIVLIQRAGDVIVPRGATHLLEGDMLLILAETRSTEEIRALFS